MGGCVFKKDEIAFRALCKNKIIKKREKFTQHEKKWQELINLKQ